MIEAEIAASHERARLACAAGALARQTILVDGFNVLHAVLLTKERESGWWRREMRERLLRRVATWPGGQPGGQPGGRPGAPPGDSSGDDAGGGPADGRAVAGDDPEPGQRPPDEIWVAFDGARPSWSVWAEPVAQLVSSAARPTGADVVPIDFATAAIASEAPGACTEPSGSTVYAVYVESADDWIVRRARKTVDPAHTLVVTADRQVAGRARSAGCSVWSPWAFMARCAKESGAQVGS